MKTNCPHCRSSVDIDSDASLADICCSSCGESFNIVGQATMTYGAGKVHSVGHFDLLEQVGVGSFGAVWKARDTELDRTVALKMPRRGQLTPEDAELFFREARAAAQLQHPNIVSVHEVGREDGTVFIVSDFVQGATLSDWLTGKQLNYRESAELVAVVADALEHAHQAGVVHRDLKPGNIMMDLEGRPFVMDFGLAKREVADVTMTVEGKVLGTPAYMSPEQARGEAHDTDSRSDVYSLGVILFQLLTGELPFRGNARMLLVQILKDDPPIPRKLAGTVPRDLETICLKCLGKNPQQRYQTAAELADDLKRWLKKEPISARPIGRIGRLVRWCQRHPLVASLTAAVIMITAIGFAGITWQWRSAVAAIKEADKQRKKAIDERTIADREKQNAQQQRDEAERSSYRANIIAAASAMRSHNRYAAQRALQSAPEKYRNWEWRHFHSRLDNSQTVLSGHKNVVVTVALSPDGTRILSGDVAGTHRLWEKATGRLISVFENTLTWNRYNLLPSWKGAFSTDGKYVFTIQKDRSIQIYSAATGETVRRLKNSRHAIRYAVFSPGGNHIATAAGDGMVRVQDVETGDTIAEIAFEQPGTRLTYSPDGKKIALVTKTSLLVSDIESCRQPIVYKLPESKVETIAFSPDSMRIALGYAYPNSFVELVNASDLKRIARLSGHQNSIVSLSFSADDSRLASASMDETVMLWDGKTGTAIATLRGHKSHTKRVVFSPDSSRCISASSDNTLRVWDAKTGELIAVLMGHEKSVYKPVYMEQGINDVAYGDDGRFCVSCGADGTLRIWDMQLAQRNGILRGHKSYVYDAAFSPDGEHVASCSWDNTVRIWHATTGQEVASFDGTDICLSVAYNPGGTRLAALSNDRTVKIWDTQSKSVLHTLSLDTTLDSGGVSFSPTGEYFAAGSGDNNAYVWQLRNGALKSTLSGHGKRITDVQFSPDGTLLATASKDQSVRIWDVKTDRLLKTLGGHAGSVNGVSFNRNASLLASCSDDGSVRFWNTKSWQEIAVLDHPDIVFDVSFSPDGTRLATGCGDNTIRLWDVQTHQEVAEIYGHDTYVHSVDFSPDGTRLVTASGDYTVRVWDTLSLQERAKKTPPQQEIDTKPISPRIAWHGRDFTPPKSYLCYRSDTPITVDGRLEEAAWKAVDWTHDFVDIEGDAKPKPRLATRAKMLWDDNYFYIAARLEEPHVWATLTEHDSVIFHDNDFEVFIDPDGDNHKYGEFEINALGTGWDLSLTKPYKDGGKPDNGWEIPGLKTAVHIEGTLNNTSDTDSYWSVEIAIPWNVLAALDNHTAPPADGEQWRVNFSRVQWRHEIKDGKYQKIKGLPEDNWVWSPQWAINMHRPETWGYVQFSTAAPGRAKFNPDPTAAARHYLHRVYYAQLEYRRTNKSWAKSFEQLKIKAPQHDSFVKPIEMKSGDDGYTATATIMLPGGRQRTVRIFQDSRVEIAP